MSKSWRDRAIDVIATCLLECEVQAVLLQEPLNAATVRKYCNDRYPFTMRQYSPYQAWLEELRMIPQFIESGCAATEYRYWRDRRDSKGQLKEGATKTRRHAIAVAAGQMDLFGMEIDR